MGLKILHNGQIADFSDSKYDPNGFGTLRLNIRTGAGSTGVKKYGLATSAAHTSDNRVRLNVNGSTYYIGTSTASSRQSNYTSYSTYNTYTYTDTYQRSNAISRTGTRTTATRTQPARYTYRASYYTGVQSGYTVSTAYTINNVTALLSGTRSSGYTAYYNGTLTIRRSSVSVTWRVLNSKHTLTVNGKTSRSFTSTPGWVSTVVVGTYATTGATSYGSTEVAAGAVASTAVAYTNTKSSTLIVDISRSRVGTRTHYHAYAAVTASRASYYYATPPNYIALAGAVQGTGGTTAATNAAGYKTASATNSTYEGYVANQSARFVYRTYSTALYQSGTTRVGNATLTSTNTPIGGVPSGYTLSAGPSVINSINSYTYTDNSCTNTYSSYYSTSYWTVTSTLTSNTPVSSSVGSTATTRASYYTEHNFV